MSHFYDIVQVSSEVVMATTRAQRVAGNTMCMYFHFHQPLTGTLFKSD